LVVRRGLPAIVEASNIPARSGTNFALIVSIRWRISFYRAIVRRTPASGPRTGRPPIRSVFVGLVWKTATLRLEMAGFPVT